MILGNIFQTSTRDGFNLNIYRHSVPIDRHSSCSSGNPGDFKNETKLKEKWYYEANYPLGNKISFVSDMTIAKSELIIAYGAGDAESRIFIVKLRDIDHYFTD